MLDEKEKHTKNAKILELIERLFDEEDEELRASLANEVLSLDPEDPVAKFVKWESLGEEESFANVAMLEEGLGATRARMESFPDGSEEYEAYRSLLVTMVSNLASCEYFNGNKERALGFAREFMDLDDEGLIPGRVIYYALLVDLKKYDEVVEAADADFCETPVGEYARAIALFETEGPSQDASAALLEAILLEPDMAFLIVGLWELEEDADEADGDEEADDLLMQVAILTDLWSATDDRLAFLGALTFAFGYLTGRIEEQKEISMLEDGYKALGCLNEMLAAKQAVEAIIAEDRDPGEVDEEALSLLQELIEQGMFS